MIHRGYWVVMALAVSGAVGASPPDGPETALRLPVGPNGPKRLKGGNPEYPLSSVARRDSGLVFLDCVIGEDGRVESVLPLAGPPELEAVAAKAVRDWVYERPTLDGRPVRVATVVSVSFVIYPDILRELLRRALLHPNPLVRESTARLEGAQGKAGIEPLMSVLGDEDPRVRTAAALGLQKIGRAARRAIPNLKTAALDLDPAVRAAATAALEALDSK